MNVKYEFFSPKLFAQLAAVESNHWWFRGRNRLILWTLANKIGNFENFLEIGCGTGFVLDGIRKEYPNVELFGSEYFEEGLVFARDRIPSATFKQVDAMVMTETNKYDVIGAFDVIEHIKHDEIVLRNLARALTQRGKLVITVPQHRWLWSEVDKQAYHIRRYTRPEIVDKVKRAGLKVDYVTSFVTLLVPLMWLARTRARQGTYDPMSEFQIPWLVNRGLEAIMNAELVLVKLGLRFPLGGSLLLVAKKS